MLHVCAVYFFSLWWCLVSGGGCHHQCPIFNIDSTANCSQFQDINDIFRWTSQTPSITERFPARPKSRCHVSGDVSELFSCNDSALLHRHVGKSDISKPCTSECRSCVELYTLPYYCIPFKKRARQQSSVTWAGILGSPVGLDPESA